MWIIDRVEGNIRERDRNGKQDELIGGWKNRPCFRTMQVIGEENREDNRVKGILETARRVDGRDSRKVWVNARGESL